jgi:hypothetical protein
VQGAPSFLQLFAAFGVLRLLVAPLLAAGFLLCACLSPTRFSRRALAGAVAVEGMAATSAVLHWFILPRLQ